MMPGLLSVLFILGVNPCIVMHNIEQTNFKFKWAASTGEVAGYEACIDGDLINRECFDTAINEFEFTPPQWKVWHIQVRAYSANKAKFSNWSVPSHDFSINPNPADVDLNGTVGISDFSILSSEWGAQVE